jgi:hypothetical protein
MLTLMKNESDFSNILKTLVELDYNAIETYDVAINRINNSVYKKNLIKFKEEHAKHMNELILIFKKHGIKISSILNSKKKSLLPKGKVVISKLMRDNSIILALISNEIEIYTAYNNAYLHANKWQDVKNILKHGIEDERQHKIWLEKTLINKSLS